MKIELDKKDIEEILLRHIQDQFQGKWAIELTGSGYYDTKAEFTKKKEPSNTGETEAEL